MMPTTVLAENQLPYQHEAFVSENTVYITSSNLDRIWHKLFDSSYDSINFVFIEDGLDSFWERLFFEAEQYTASLSAEEWYEIYAAFELQQQEEAYFWENLSPEFLWNYYIEANPTILLQRGSAIEETKERILQTYNNMILARDRESITAFSGYSITGGAVAAWTRNFNDEDGLGATARNAINADGLAAINRSEIRYTADADALRRDAYRHYSWNYLAVTNPLVGITRNNRVANTRIFTTNRELASMIVRANPNLNATNITAQLQTTGRAARNAILQMNRASWHEATNASNATRDDLMDLWNNYWGRVDGAGQSAFVPNLHSDFVTRWNNTTATSGIQRTNASMTLARRNHLFDNDMHRPN